MSLKVMRLPAKLALLLVCIHAHAEWTLMSVGDSPKTWTYLDFDSLRPVTPYLRIWMLTDYESDNSTRGGIKYRSSRTLKEYDCANDQSRTLAISFTDGQFGGGSVVSSDMDISKPTNWSPHIPNSYGQQWAQIVCNFSTIASKPKNWSSAGGVGSISIYIDKANVQRSGPIAKTKVMFDFGSERKEAGNSGARYFSAVYSVEFNCNDLTYRELSSINYSRARSEGKITSLYYRPDSTFETFVPDDVVDLPFKAACGTK